MNIVIGNLLDAQAPVIIVHQVNDLGFMGAGLALQIRNKYPNVYNIYRKHANSSQIGNIQLVKIGDNRYICNMFSQKGISRVIRTTDYNAMRICFQKLAKLNIPIALPYKIGCGLAGGDWAIVSQMIDEILPSATVYKKY